LSYLTIIPFYGELRHARSSPSDNRGKFCARQRTDDDAASDFNYGLVLGFHRMEVRRRMISEINVELDA